MPSYQYRKSYCGDKTILRPSYLHNGISYSGKMASWYWIGALASAVGGVTHQSWDNMSGVSNHLPNHCLLNHLFRHRSKKTSKLCVTGLHSADRSNEFPYLHTTQTGESEVYASVVTEWPPACLHKLPLRGHQRATEENLEWKMFST